MIDRNEVRKDGSTMTHGWDGDEIDMEWIASQGEVKNPPPADTPEYRSWYEKGWRYSHSESATLDHGDRKGYPDAWYQGYLDFAAGREKWHMLNCPDHDGTN